MASSASGSLLIVINRSVILIETGSDSANLAASAIRISARDNRERSRWCWQQQGKAIVDSRIGARNELSQTRGRWFRDISVKSPTRKSTDAMCREFFRLFIDRSGTWERGRFARGQRRFGWLKETDRSSVEARKPGQNYRTIECRSFRRSTDLITSSKFSVWKYVVHLSL